MPRLPFLLLAALLSGASAAAQTTYKLGLRGGANRAITTLGASGNSPGSYPFSYSADKSAIYAWQAGAVLEIAFRKFSVQPALLFSQKGEVFHMQTSHSGVAGTSRRDTRRTSRVNWLELPVNVVYTVHGVQLSAGPYVALAVSGRQQSTWRFISSTPIVGPTESAYGGNIAFDDGSHNRRFDAGVNFNVGYRRGPLQVQLGYGVGLRNLHQVPAIDFDNVTDPQFNHDFDADAAYNRVAQLSATYFLEL